MEKEKKDIIEGKLEIFAGPIKGQDGKVKVEKDKKVTDKELLEMNWFVEGVEGKVSK